MREAQRQRNKRSGVGIASETSSKTSRSHLVPTEYNKRDITPAMSSVTQEDGKKFSHYTD